MIPCKEDLVELERLAKRQKLMYQDAADRGVPYAEIDLPTYRKTVKNLMDFYAYTTHKWASGKEVKMFIPFEVDGGLYEGVEVTVSGMTDRKVIGGGFVSIDIVRTTRPLSTEITR